MNLIGSINLSAPDLEEKQMTFEGDAGCEFYLETKKGTKPSVDDFDISIEMDRDEEIVISTDIEAPEQQDIFRDSLVIGIESKGVGSIGLSLSIAQICALIQVLERYRECYYAVKALATERVVKAA